MTKILKDVDIEEIKEEYAPRFDIFTDEQNYTYRIKRIVSELDETDKRIILLYADMQSQRKVAAALGISTSLANIKINEIRKKIINELHNNNKPDINRIHNSQPD